MRPETAAAWLRSRHDAKLILAVIILVGYGMAYIIACPRYGLSPLGASGSMRLFGQRWESTLWHPAAASESLLRSNFWFRCAKDLDTTPYGFATELNMQREWP